jgi:galactokinase
VDSDSDDTCEGEGAVGTRGEGGGWGGGVVKRDSPNNIVYWI